MKNKALPRSFKISIAVIICLTVFVFSFLGMSVRNMSEDTIEEIGIDYMAGMNEQVSLHFETIIELRLTMAESIAHIAAGDENSALQVQRKCARTYHHQNSRQCGTASYTG